MKGITVKLNENELKFLDTIAHQRNDPKEQNNIPSGQMGNVHRKSVENHLIGLKGEYATGIVLGIPLNTEMYYLEGDKGKGDLTLLDDITISVKTRTKRWQEFALETNDLGKFKDNYGVLAIPGEADNTIEVFGWTTKEEFVKKHVVGDFSSGQSRAWIKQEDMRDIRELIMFLNKIRATKHLNIG